MRSQSLRIFLTDFNTNYIIIYLMPSRADDSFLRRFMVETLEDMYITCQCPLGLMTHFYQRRWKSPSYMVIVSMPSRADDSFLRRHLQIEPSFDYYSVNALSGWWLISTEKRGIDVIYDDLSVNALSGWWLISTEISLIFNSRWLVSMPSRADDSFLPQTRLGIL